MNISREPYQAGIRKNGVSFKRRNLNLETELCGFYLAPKDLAKDAILVTVKTCRRSRGSSTIAAKRQGHATREQYPKPSRRDPPRAVSRASGAHPGCPLRAPWSPGTADQRDRSRQARRYPRDRLASGPSFRHDPGVLDQPSGEP